MIFSVKTVLIAVSAAVHIGLYLMEIFDC